MTAPEDAIRARRRLTNKLIAAHDAARLRPFFAADANVIVGDGSLILGAEAVIQAFAGQFADPAFIAYERTTERVALDADGARAAEHGRWIGTWKDSPPMSGDYLAVWRKVTGQWLIESELYVTLGG
jgi:ketosteroid isomerase-like protein